MELNGSNDVPKTYKKFPFEIVDIDKSADERVSRHFSGAMTGRLLVGPEKWIMPKLYRECAEKLYNFEARFDDIWVCTYMRSGTTWTQQMIWLLCNNLNYEAANATKLDFRFPFFEMDSLISSDEEPFPEQLKTVLPDDAIKLLAETSSPRFIKTHLPIKLMPHDTLAKGCKIVYVARNPKDVLVSLLHFFTGASFSFTGNLEELLDFFMDDLIIWGPFFEHIKDGWNHRNDGNVLFLYYEDLIMDLENSLKKLATFLGRPLKEHELPGLMEHLHIKNFKSNHSVNKTEMMNLGPVPWEFVRRGQIGGNPEMTSEISEKIDEWMDVKLKGTDIVFPHQFRHKLEKYKLQAAKQWKK